MELTWLFASSILLVGVGYAFVRRASRIRSVRWSLLCASLFALATRDLFRSRERGRPASTPAGESFERRPERTDDDRRRRAPLFDRLRRRIAGWLD